MDSNIRHEATRKTVLLVGGSGDLGSLVGLALLGLGARLRVLLRPGGSTRLLPAIAERAEIVYDRTDALAGVDTVVSAIQGGAEAIVDVQLDLLRRARAAGVRRFIPSDFSFDFFALDDGENVNSDLRRQFARTAALERGDLEVVHVMSGCFIDRRVLFGFLGAFDDERNEAYLWGDGNEKMQFTTYADTAAYTANIALDTAAVAERIHFAGDSLDFHELAAAVGEAQRRPVKTVRMGTLADLRDEIGRRREANPHQPLSWLPLMYWHGMLSGRGRLGELSNSRYPAIRPCSVQDYTASMLRQTT